MKNKNIIRLNEFILKHTKLSIIIVYNIIVLAFFAIFYPILPILMGYPPNCAEISEHIGISYKFQYIIIVPMVVIIGIAYLSAVLKDIDKWNISLENTELDITQLRNIRRKCINLPYSIYIFQIVFITIPGTVILFIVAFIIKAPIIILLRIIMLGFSMSSLIAIVLHIFTQQIFTKILLRTYIEERVDGIRISFKTKMFLQVLPLFTVAVLFTGMLGYSKIIQEKGDLVYYICNELLQENADTIQGGNAEQILNSMPKLKCKKLKISYFTLLNGKFISSDGYKPTAYFSCYISHPTGTNNNRVYGDTNEVQGVIKQIHSDTGDIIVGIKYELSSYKTVLFFFIELAILLTLFVFILYYISKTFTQKISSVAQSLNEISEGEYMGQHKKIPVTSNDEISDLVISFNKLRDRELAYDKLKTEFIANISHELRTPVNIMLSAIQLIELYKKKDMINDSDKLDKNLNTIKQNCLRLARLINNLIDLTRIDAGYLKLQSYPVNIVNLIKEITVSVTEYAKSKNIALEFETQIHDKVISCDADKIERIMLNLISNAIKFTEDGGNISVKVYDEGDSVVVSVKDTGIGIPKDKHTIIFERFRQVEQLFIRNYEGSGIGLSLVKLLVEMHQGNIWVESEEGAGSEFFLELPVNTQLTNDMGKVCKIHTANNNIMHKIKIELSDIYISG